MRALQKYAVRMGGGHNHRQNLGDGILIKDNHIAALRAQGMSLADTVRLAEKRASHTIKIEVEVTNMEESRRPWTVAPSSYSWTTCPWRRCVRRWG